MISDHVVFSSPHFRIEPGEDSETNPGIFGRALATWVASQLRSRGVPIEEVIPEDYGRAVIIYHKPFRLWVACASLDGETDRWQMFIAAEQGLLGKLFGGAKLDAEVRQFRAHYRALVEAVPNVSNVEWQDS
jgi:hypothetical protein